MILDSGFRRNDGQKAREEMEWVEFKHKKTPIDAGLIRLHSGTRRDACYVPFWA